MTNNAIDVFRTDASPFVSLSVILSNMKLDFLGLWIFIPQAFEAIAFWSGGVQIINFEESILFQNCPIQVLTG